MIICLVLGFVVLWLKERQNKPEEKEKEMLDLWSEKLIANDSKIDPSIVGVPVNFSYTGAVQTYIVPNGCKKLKVDCVGARGGYYTKATSTMGKGGRVECILSVKSNQVLYLYVGGAGANNSHKSRAFNGGGGYSYYTNGSKGGGGGASDIRTVEATSGSWYDTSHTSWDEDASLLSRLVVAGGGGGYGSNGGGGYGGGLEGGKGRGTGTASVAYGGSGGTQTSGGVIGSGISNPPSSVNGQFGFGGDTNAKADVVYGYTGGGGGGWYGGGLGGYSGGGGGGGGGSSYTHPDKCTEVIHTQGYSGGTGNGYIILTPIK